MAGNACSAATSGFFSFLLLLLPCLLSSQVHADHASKLNTTQTRILKRIFHTIQLYTSPYEFLNTTAVNPCAWRGVGCYSSYTSDGVVVNELDFSNLGIAFNNSTALSSFFSLICSLDTLWFLNLSRNHLTSIPGAFFSSCTGISTLNLSQNSLSGKIPSQFSNLIYLSYLHLNGNNLSGSIPSTLTIMNYLRDLQLGDNKLSGTIPIMPPSIRALNLSYNSFRGHILSSSFDNSFLEILDLSHSNFSGSVPNSLTCLNFLFFLDLSYNNLSGELPIFW
ncbi:LRR receptor-like serine/threonine-protein kinase GSO1 [Rhynchospora pubera]|uniref:LRR receptor-like serine/threonine-protein kinase GSO1 n=1 Tax=Rhynchospora pubera TaxID=906938 RepID=A0AAV8DH22_9POAL|nr:LRR receptor-like serine/threonine-protein kinase GSO1 [Rhynchospora pubera]